MDNFNPDFTKMFEAVFQMQQKINGQMKPIVEGMAIFQNNLAESAKPIVEGMARLLSNFAESSKPIVEGMARFQSNLAESSVKLVKAFRPIIAINKLGEAQFVNWDFLTDEFVDEILLSNNINKTLREICMRDNFRKVNSTIDMCSNNAIIAPYNRIFHQVVATYRNKQYDLATIGLITVIDGVLSDISEDIATSLFKRANTILNKIEETDSLENDEYAILSLTLTFKDTMESLSSKSDFNGKEPKNLNRHWLMHGRSRRRRSLLDCIKLFNFLYSILLLDKLGNAEKE